MTSFYHEKSTEYRKRKQIGTEFEEWSMERKNKYKLNDNMGTKKGITK